MTPENKPEPTLPNPNEPLYRGGSAWLEVLALVLIGAALIFMVYAMLAARP